MRRTQRAAAVVVAALLGSLLGWFAAGAGLGSPEVPRTTDQAALLDPGSPVPGPGTDPTRGPAPVAGRGPEAAGRPVREIAVRPARLSGVRRPPPPSRVRIPSLWLDMPVLAAGVDDRGFMRLPPTPFEAAWYRFGPGPTDPAGATVIAGHVDSEGLGRGPLADLAALEAGDRIEVIAGAEPVRYRVRSVQRVAKATLDLPAVFSRAGPPRLHLLTCGGRFIEERGSYEDNVVVVAGREPVQGRRS